MSLSSGSFSAGITFTETQAIAGFGSAKHGPVSLQKSGNLNLTNVNKVFAAQYSLAASGTQTLDLTSLTDAFGNALAFGHVVYLMVTSVDGQPGKIGPGASNGLTWFLDDSTAYVAFRASGFVLVGDGDGSGTNQAVDSTHKTLTVTNTGSATGSFGLVILGS